MPENTDQFIYDFFDLDNGDAGELLKFFADEYGDTDPSKPEYFEWFCKNNPAGKGIVVIVRDIDTGLLIGQSWFTPLKARIERQDFTGYIGASGIIHPKYRRKGIFEQLIKFSHENLGDKGMQFGTIFPGNRTKKIAPKTNMKSIGQFDLLIKILDWNFLSRTQVARIPAVQKSFSVLGNYFRRNPSITKKGNRYQDGIFIREISSFGDEFNEFWTRVLDKYPNMYVRNSEFLNWRFSIHPTRKYQILSAVHDGSVIGYIVIRITEFNGFPAAFIVDFLVEPSPIGNSAGEILVKNAVHIINDASQDIIIGMAQPGKQEYKLLRKQGFIRCPRRLQPVPMNLHTIRLSPDIPEESLQTQENWFIQLGDIDIF